MSFTSAAAHTLAESQPSFRSSTTSVYVYTIRAHGDAGDSRGKRTEAHSLQVLVDGPSKESALAVPRHAAALNSLSLTGLVIPKVGLGAGVTALSKQWEEYGVDKKWLESPYAKKIEKATRRKGLSDFERFKVMRLRKDVSILEHCASHGLAAGSHACILREERAKTNIIHRPVSRPARLLLLPRHRWRNDAPYPTASWQHLNGSECISLGKRCTDLYHLGERLAHGGRKGYLQAFDSGSSMAFSRPSNVVT